MRIDNSMRSSFAKCPDHYRESYVNKITPQHESNALLFGSRMHELLEDRFRAMGDFPAIARETPPENPLELEAQTTLAAYNAHWPIKEAFTVVAVEELFEVPIPGTSHTVIGKFDGILRDVDGRLVILEHKTERRGSSRNLPQEWIMRPQVSLYMWAAAQLYDEPIAYTLLDVIVRQSPKGREPAQFYRDQLERTAQQQLDAVNDLRYYADEIERVSTMFANAPHWPRNCDQCRVGNWSCDYLKLHALEGDDGFLRANEYKPKKEYLIWPTTR